VTRAPVVLWAIVLLIAFIVIGQVLYWYFPDLWKVWIAL
jgi:hypothetical protein